MSRNLTHDLAYMTYVTETKWGRENSYVRDHGFHMGILEGFTFPDETIEYTKYRVPRNINFMPFDIQNSDDPSQQVKPGGIANKEPVTIVNLKFFAATLPTSDWNGAAYTRVTTSGTSSVAKGAIVTFTDTTTTLDSKKFVVLQVDSPTQFRINNTTSHDEIDNVSLEMSPAPKIIRSYNGINLPSVRNWNAIYDGKKSYSGSIPDFRMINGQILPFIFGRASNETINNGFFKHYILESQELPSFTWEAVYLNTSMKKEDILVRRARGCKINKATISANEGEEIKISLDEILAKGVRHNIDYIGSSSKEKSYLGYEATSDWSNGSQVTENLMGYANNLNYNDVYKFSEGTVEILRPSGTNSPDVPSFESDEKVSSQAYGGNVNPYGGVGNSNLAKIRSFKLTVNNNITPAYWINNLSRVPYHNINTNVDELVDEGNPTSTLAILAVTKSVSAESTTTSIQTASNHGLETGDTIFLQFNDIIPNGTYSITKTGNDTFTILYNTYGASDPTVLGVIVKNPSNVVLGQQGPSALVEGAREYELEMVLAASDQYVYNLLMSEGKFGLEKRGLGIRISFTRQKLSNFEGDDYIEFRMPADTSDVAGLNWDVNAFKYTEYGPIQGMGSLNPNVGCFIKSASHPVEAADGERLVYVSVSWEVPSCSVVVNDKFDNYLSVVGNS
jgi:hypothetical protein